MSLFLQCSDSYAKAMAKAVFWFFVLWMGAVLICYAGMALIEGCLFMVYWSAESVGVVIETAISVGLIAVVSVIWCAYIGRD